MLVKRNIFVFYSLIFVIMSMTCVQAQTNSEKLAPFYIDLNTLREGQVYTAQVDIMGIKYDDKFGKWNELPIEVFNWKQERVAGVTLAKTFGVNYFTLRLSELYTDWEFDKIYRCEFSDESGRKYVLPIKPISPPEKAGPDIDLLINPISLSCTGVSKNMVEFYGSIAGGKAPYKIDWFVLNDQRTDFLYQPREEKISKAGNTAFIQVDKDPDYYVLFVVQDACGSVKEKMVHMVCEESQKKVNTVFVEPLNDQIVKSFLKIR